MLREWKDLTDREQKTALDVLHEARQMWSKLRAFEVDREELLEVAIQFVDNSRRKFEKGIKDNSKKNGHKNGKK